MTAAERRSRLLGEGAAEVARHADRPVVVTGGALAAGVVATCGHKQFKARAALSGLSLPDYLIRDVKKIAEQPTPEEVPARLKTREPYRGRLSPTEAVRQERDGR